MQSAPLDASAPLGALDSAARKFLLFNFSIYLALGSMPRFLPLQGAKSNLVITEFLLYFASALYFLARTRRIRIPLELWVVAFTLMVSTFVGALKSGFDFTSFSYAARFAVLTLACFAAGDALYTKYGQDAWRATSRYILWPFTVSALIGWILYIVFPQAAALWAFLRTFGIEFAGDAHTHRLLSSYFDPNLFGSIAVFAFCLAHTLYSNTRKRAFLYLAIFFFISELFTISRSGLATMLLYCGFVTLFNVRHLRINRWGVMGAFALMMVAVLAFPLYAEAVNRILDRLNTNVTIDVSSLNRLYSAQIALNEFQDNPMLGIGFNYSSFYNRNGWAIPDSAVMTVLSTMGIVTGLLFSGGLGIFFSRGIVRTLRAGRRDTAQARLAQNFLIYFLISVFFSSNFVNLLFYQFWFVPAFTLASYLNIAFAANRQDA